MSIGGAVQKISQLPPIVFDEKMAKTDDIIMPESKYNSIIPKQERIIKDDIIIDISAEEQLKNLLKKRINANGSTFFDVIDVTLDRDKNMSIYSSDPDVSTMISLIEKTGIKPNINRYVTKTKKFSDFMTGEINQYHWVEDSYLKKSSRYYENDPKIIKSLESYANILNIVSRFSNIYLA